MQSKNPDNNTREKATQPPSMPRFGWAFFKIGLTAYGMAILQQLKALIINSQWLSRKEVDEGLAMVQLYPGPIMFNLANYAAYRIKGFGGALLATVLFVFPSYLLMVFLSWIYFSYGEVPWVHPLFIALEAMVVGVVAHIFVDFSNRYLTGPKTALMAALAFILLLFKVHAFAVVLISIVLGILLFWNTRKTPAANTATPSAAVVIPGNLRHRLLSLIAAGVVFIGAILLGLFWRHTNGELLLSMFKIGAVAFGNGMTIMPLLQQEAVISHHWLTMKQFADGIAFGQITPGPFLITATFIGYKVSGLWGSVIATFGMFYPSFFYTLVISEIYSRIKNNPLIQTALKGVLAAFTGMLLSVVFSLGKVSLISPAAYIWAAGALVAVRYFKLNLLWIFAAGIAAAMGLFYLGITI